MKNNWLKTKKGYFGMLFACLVIVAVFAGIGTRNMNQLKQTNPITPQNEPQQQGEPEAAAEPVVSSKNAPAKITYVPPVKTEDTAENDSDQTVAQADTNGREPVVLDEDEYEQTAQFEDDLLLQWPITGDIVMDYSIDHVIYDVTLDQYRTNDSVSISADAGADVKAASKGVVDFVGTDEEKGTTVVINHGNGWQTTYSQLSEDLAVDQGQTVKAGQVIGQVSEPTKYVALLGSHLDFKVTRDDMSVDPKVAIAQ